MTEQNARHLDASAESFTQWPEAVREYEKLKEESAPPLGHMLRTADAAIEALKEMVEEASSGDPTYGWLRASIKFQRERAEKAEAEAERLRWMLATLIEDFDCAEMVDDYVADLAARWEKENSHD